jgi:hypothetical protein
MIKWSNRYVHSSTFIITHMLWAAWEYLHNVHQILEERRNGAWMVLFMLSTPKFTHDK